MNASVETIAAAVDPVEALAARLRTRYGARITGELVVPARQGQYVALPEDLDARLVTALAARGVQRLYTHQGAAWESVQAGKHTVIVTPTASGKTLCYNLPVLHTALRNRSDRPVHLDGQDVMPEVRNVLKKMARLTDQVQG